MTRCCCTFNRFQSPHLSVLWSVPETGLVEAFFLYLINIYMPVASQLVEPCIPVEANVNNSSSNAARPNTDLSYIRWMLAYGGSIILRIDAFEQDI